MERHKADDELHPQHGGVCGRVVYEVLLFDELILSEPVEDYECGCVSHDRAHWSYRRGSHVDEGPLQRSLVPYPSKDASNLNLFMISDVFLLD